MMEAGWRLDKSENNLNFHAKTKQRFFRYIRRKMVILHVKRTDLNQFLYETNTSVPVADLLDQLVRSKLITLKQKPIQTDIAFMIF